MPAFYLPLELYLKIEAQHGFMRKSNMIIDLHIYIYFLMHFLGFDLLFMFL